MREPILEKRVEEVIVSVPAYFNDAQRYATKLGGNLLEFRLIGLSMSLPQLLLLKDLW